MEQTARHRVPFAALEPFLPVSNRCRVLGTNTPTLRRVKVDGLLPSIAERWCARLGLDPATVWSDWLTADQEVEARFWAKVNKNGPVIRPELGACWIWTGATHSFGYGVFRGRAKNYLAHDYSLSLITPRPVGMEACHACDNPPCVRPDHLRWGTHLSNVHEAVERDRHMRGTRFPLARLSDIAVIAIRESYAAGTTLPELSRIYGVGSAHLSTVVNGKTWKHIGGLISVRSGKGARTKEERACRTT